MRKIKLLLLGSVFIIVVGFLAISKAYALSYSRITDLNNLPETQDSIETAIDSTTDLKIGIINFTRIKNSEDMFELKIRYEDTIYESYSKLPLGKKLKDEFIGYYYSKKINGKVNRYLYYDYASDEDAIKYSVDITKWEAHPWISRVIWNITTNDYILKDRIDIYGFFKARTGHNDYFDFIFSSPVSLEKMMYLTLNFDYQQEHKKNGWKKEAWRNRTLFFNCLNYSFGFHKDGSPVFISPAKLEELKKIVGEKLFDLVDSLKEDVFKDYSDDFASAESARTSFLESIQKDLAKSYKRDYLDVKEEDRVMTPMLKKYIEVWKDNPFKLSQDIFPNPNSTYIWKVPVHKYDRFADTTNTNFRNARVINLVFQTGGVNYYATEDNIASWIPDKITKHKSFWSKIKKFFKKIGQGFKKFWFIIFASLIGIGAIVVISFISKKGKK